MSDMERPACPACGTTRNQIIIFERGAVKQQLIWCANPSCVAYGVDAADVPCDELVGAGQPA